MFTPNECSQEQSPLPNTTSIHSDASEDHSAQFSPSPPPSKQQHDSPHSRSQPHLHLEENDQSQVPLLHHESGLPITVSIDPSLPSTTASHPFLDDQPDSQPHLDLIPAAQFSNPEHHHGPSSSSIIQKAPLTELPLHLLLQAEDEFDLERLGQIAERLRDANDRMSAVAPQHTGDSNAPAAETDIGGASAHAHNTINSRELSLEDQAGAGSSHVMSKEMVKIDQNHRDGIDGGENLHRSMNKGITQRRNRDTFDSENLPNQENASRETVKSEPVLEQLEGTHRQEQLGLSELEDGVHDEIIAQSPRGAGDNENTSDPSSAHVQPHDSPATSDRVQPRQTGRKRGRGEVESRYWTRSKKPHSSSKRSRRTNYWLRP